MLKKTTTRLVMAKKGLYHNINKRKKAGTSRSKSNSTISAESYSDMKSGFNKGGKIKLRPQHD